MAEIVTPGAAGPILPPEYQAQIDEARRKSQIAQMLQQMSMGYKGPQQIGPVAAKISPLAGLANIATGGIGAFVGNQAEGDATKARQQFENDSLAETRRIQGLPEADAIREGQASKFSTAQQIAKTMQAQQEKRRELSGKAFSDAGQLPQALDTYAGRTPSPVTPPREPVTNWIPDPNNPGKSIPQTQNFDKHGIPHAVLGTAGSTNNVDIKLPTKEGELALGQIGKTLDERRASATAAKTVLASNSYAMDALEKGAAAGGGEGQKQWVRKAAQAFNVTLPETATTEQLQMALGSAILENAQKIKPVSNTDMEVLKQMLGSIPTDPTALVKMLAFTSAASLQDMHGYNQYAGENQKSMNPAVQDLFRGATTGYELPRQLTGSTPYQYEIVRQLQRRGFPIETLADGSGKAFDPNSKFDINVTKGLPGVEGKIPAPPTGTPAGTAGNPLTLDQLTPEQKAMLRKLLGQ